MLFNPDISLFKYSFSFRDFTVDLITLDFRVNL